MPTLSPAIAALVVLASLGYATGSIDKSRQRSTVGRLMHGVAIVGCATVMFLGLAALHDGQVVIFSAGALLAYGIGMLAARSRLQRNRSTPS